MTYTLPWKIQSPPQLVKSSSEEIRCKFIVVFIGSCPIDMCVRWAVNGPSIHNDHRLLPGSSHFIHLTSLAFGKLSRTQAGHHPGYLCPMSRSCVPIVLQVYCKKALATCENTYTCVSLIPTLIINHRSGVGKSQHRNLLLLEIFESLICVFKSEMFRRIPREQVSTAQWAGVAQKMSLLLLILRPSPSAS